MDRQFDEQFDTLGFDNALESNPETPEAFGGRRLDFGDEDFVTLGGAVSEVLEAEDEAVRDSEAEWLETEWLETSGDNAPGESVEAFAERLAREWSSRKPDGPDAETRRAALIKDHADTLAAARLRWSPKKVKPDFWSRVSRGWMTTRQEEMRFETEAASVAGLPLAPPAARVPLTEDRLVGGTLDKEVKGKLVAGAKIAPLTVRFAHALRKRHPSVGMTNYHNHGGGSFINRGYSLDLWLSAVDDRGFFRHDDAVRLLRAVDAAAKAVGAQWRVLYNDFAVADTINRELRRRHVVFMGRVRRDKAGRLGGLNWHGPAPLILHFHLDITPVSGVDQAGETSNEQWAGSSGEWMGESFTDAGEDELFEDRGRYDPEDARASEQGAFEGWNEAEGEDLDYEGPAASPLETAGLTQAERKALDITSTFETGRPGSFFGLTGNDDGQGISFGLVNWPIGTGSLQPLLREFATEQAARWNAIFGPDAERFRHVIIPRNAVASQLRFAVEEMNGTQLVRGRTRWYVKKPWSDYFRRLADDREFQKIQIRHVRPMMRKAEQYCHRFKLRSEMAFAFMFDAVSSHGGAWLRVYGREKLLERKLAERGLAVGSASEADLLLAMADVLSETSRKRYAANVRQRKRWFVLGDAELERRRGLTGMRPSATTPYQPRGTSAAREDEDLAWLAYEAGATAQFEDEDEWSGETGFDSGEQFDFGESSETQEGYELGEAFESGEAHESAGAWGEEESGSHAECSCKRKQAPQGFDEWPGEADETTNFSTELEEEGGEAFGSCPFEALLSADEALAEQIYLAEDEDFADETGDCSGELGPAECEPFRGRKKVIRAGNGRGLVLARTVNDPQTELSLQFADYDINETNSQKQSHQDGINQVTQFILSRVRAGSPKVVVHLSGSASRTDTASYNRRLACHRARCLASTIRLSLTDHAKSKTSFVIDDKGFDAAVCRAYPGGKGENCELGEFRSVRVTITGPAGKVVPVPISPAHDQFEIRVCRFESKGLDVVAMDEILSRLPAQMPREVAEVLVKILKSKLLQALEKRAPLLLKRALGAITAELKSIPIQFMRQRAIFQIRERNRPVFPDRKSEIRTITLCYEGWGARLAIPFDTLIMDGIDEMLGRIRSLQRNPAAKRLLSEVLKKVLSPVLTQRLRMMGTETPSHWKPFLTKKPVLIEKFEGKADILIDLLSSMVDPGTIHLAFEGHEWNGKVNASPNSLSCGDCSGPVIPLIVSGGGFDIWSVNTGSMVSRNCVCAPALGERALEYA